MQKFSNYILSVIGALLLWAAWPTSSFTFLIFFALIPLLVIEDNISSSKRLFGYTYLHMLLWNALTTWWIYHASAIGAAMAIFLNSLIMCVPWLLAHWVKKRIGRWVGYLSLIAFWLSFEFFHHRWELSWPWLTLGNAFAIKTFWVQWYSATGTAGGSLWILLTNILAYAIIVEYRANGRTKNYFIGIVSLVILLVTPIFISKNILKNYIQNNPFDKGAVKNVVVVQPNIDPYDEKFSAGSQEEQIQKFLLLTEQKIDTNTALVIWPETAVAIPVWEDQITTDSYYQSIWEFLKQHPQLSSLTGISSYKNYGSDKKKCYCDSTFQ